MQPTNYTNCPECGHTNEHGIEATITCGECGEEFDVPEFDFGL